MARIIVRIETTKGVAYELNKPYMNVGDGEIGYDVKSIQLRRDGLQSVVHRDCGHYLIILVNPLNDKDVIYKAIPHTFVEDIMFIEKEDKESSSCETTTKIKRG